MLTSLLRLWTCSYSVGVSLTRGSTSAVNQTPHTMGALIGDFSPTPNNSNREMYREVSVCTYYVHVHIWAIRKNLEDMSLSPVQSLRQPYGKPTETLGEPYGTAAVCIFLCRDVFLCRARVFTGSWRLGAEDWKLKAESWRLRAEGWKLSGPACKSAPPALEPRIEYFSL
jgi:hypothetical protein